MEVSSQELLQLDRATQCRWENPDKPSETPLSGSSRPAEHGGLEESDRWTHGQVLAGPIRSFGGHFMVGDEVSEPFGFDESTNEFWVVPSRHSERAYRTRDRFIVDTAVRGLKPMDAFFWGGGRIPGQPRTRRQ